MKVIDSGIRKVPNPKYYRYINHTNHRNFETIFIRDLTKGLNYIVHRKTTDKMWKIQIPIL